MEDDTLRKLADLGLSSVKEEIFGSEASKGKSIIDSESTHKFLASRESFSVKWDNMERNIFAGNLSFQSIFKATYRDDMSLKDNMARKDDFFYNNVQQSSNFVFKSKIKEKKATEREGYTPLLKCTWMKPFLYIRVWLNNSRDPFNGQCLEKVHMFFPLLISIWL